MIIDHSEMYVIKLHMEMTYWNQYNVKTFKMDFEPQTKFFFIENM